MPDDEEQQDGAVAPDAEAAGEGGEAGSEKVADGTSSDEESGGEEDQDALMAEWEAMAAEGETPEAEPAAAAAAATEESGDDPSKIPAINEVDLEAYAILGTSSMPVSQLLRMGRGAVVELETGLGDQIEVKINNMLVARGEVVVVDDRIAIEITEIVKREGQ